MLPPFTVHDRLKNRHGFFGRRGGVSEGVYSSLNTGLYSSDTVNHVTENRDRVRDALGAKHLVSLSQIHSTEVVILDEIPTEPRKADGLVTALPGIAISALSADCGPILFEDTEAGLIGACHAGWRGAVDGIIESTVAALCECGAETDRINAVLGPCISGENYEVGKAFKDALLERGEEFEPFFKAGPLGTPHFDLPAFILSRLQACGVTSAIWTGDCTYADETRYFSYRRNTHQGLNGYGRNISAIMIAE